MIRLYDKSVSEAEAVTSETISQLYRELQTVQILCDAMTTRLKKIESRLTILEEKE